MRPLNISGSQAQGYYYGKDVIFGSKDNSRWHGRLSEQFGLSGLCKEHDFLNIVSGNDANGNQIIKDGVNGEHRAAVDIPLSAPKSVSVLALHGGDRALIEAHQNAVAETIGYIENNYLYARKTVDGVTRAFRTDSGLFATFMHSTSRANEPHLHTHTLTMNMTRTEDGFRAVFNDPVFKDQTLLNYVYQSELAKNVRGLGYGITNDAGGKWEIAGFRQEWIERFSTRSKEIDESMEHIVGSEREHEARKRDRAQKSSRSEKDFNLSAEELKKTWQEKVPRKDIIKAVEEGKAKVAGLEEKPLSAEEYIAIAYNAIHENESTFTRQDTVKVALELSRGRYTVAEIERAFFETVRIKELEVLKTHINKKGLETVIYTSRQMRRTEQGIVRKFDRHREDMEALVTPAFVREAIEKNHAYFTDDQKNVVENILTSSGRFSIVQGDAGTGKTYALTAVKSIVDHQNDLVTDGPKIEITGLGFTGKATREISEKAGIASRTLDSFLNKSDLEDSDKRKLWIVDESSMVGSRQMEAVMNRAAQQDAKVVFIGDGKQLQAISAGRMFKELQARGPADIVKMEEVLRQKTDYMKAAVRHVKTFQNGRSTTGIDDAFGVFQKENRLHEITDHDDRIGRAAGFFLDQEDKNRCIIVTPINEDRTAINEIVHNALRPKDQVELDINIHTPVYLNGTTRYFAQSYKAGQKAFIEHSTIAGLEPGREVTITSVDIENNRLTISTGTREHDVDLKNGDVSFSVYNVEKRRFFEGEKIVFLKNDKSLDISNGQTATIKKFGPERVVAVDIDGRGRETKINLDFYPYIDRGYAVTVHKSQGQTARDVVMVTDSRQPLNKTETFYVALSRAEESFTLFTDETEAVKAQFKEAQPKTSTIELVRDMSRQKSVDRSLSLER